jgi:hypothetical protein
MATSFVAQAPDPKSLWPRLHSLAESEGVDVEGDAVCGTFRRTDRALAAARRPLCGNYRVRGARVTVEAEQPLEPSVVFVRLARPASTSSASGRPVLRRKRPLRYPARPLNAND